MTRYFHTLLFFRVVSLLPSFGDLASITESGQTHLDAHTGEAEQSELQNALLRREPLETMDGMRLPADLDAGDDSQVGHQLERETLPDLTVGAAVIDQSGRLVTPTSLPRKPFVNPHDIDVEKARSATPAPAKQPTKNVPKSTKTEDKHTATEDNRNGYHAIGLSICVALLVLVFSVHRKSIKSAAGLRPAGSADSSGSSLEPPSPPRLQDDAQRADEDANAPALSNEAAWIGLQFLGILFLVMGCTRLLVCHGFKMQCDHEYNIGLFFRQDFHKVVLDMVFLFIFGRLAVKSCLPINSLAFLAVVFISALVPSWMNELDFMHHSLSLYQMACSWTVWTWVASLSLLMCVASLAAVHLQHYFFIARPAEKARAVVELIVILCIFVLPVCFQSGFHIHHWYYMWLLAIGCRLPTLLSRGTQAFLIGGYINGIAVYGRDPVLACEAAYDSSYSQQCKFLMQCTWNTATGPERPTYVGPDWRTCAAGDYAL